MESFQENDQDKTKVISTESHRLVTLLGVITVVIVIALLGTVLYLGAVKDTTPKAKSHPSPTDVLPTSTPVPTPIPSTNAAVEQSVTIIPKEKPRPSSIPPVPSDNAAAEQAATIIQNKSK